ncbi:MAG: transcriptional repressor LexA [Deferribacteraceae bacterium]|jgi:repressor LexA|nr:transcriptional repressor LexA [Deferribacteraceae bacterium]
MKITDKQAAFLKFIENFHRDNGYAPSVRDIAGGLGLASTSGVQSMIERLSSKGLLNRGSGVARSLSLANVESPTKAFSDSDKGVPILGHIRAGMPVMSEENIEGHIPVKDFITNSSGGFFLIVDGESMKDKGIYPGDYVFIKPQREISNGQVGAFRVNGEVTLKTYRRSGDLIELIPANEDFEPIIVTPEDSFEVIGRFVMLLRMVERGYEHQFRN